jgi:hypothetical protein
MIMGRAAVPVAGRLLTGPWLPPHPRKCGLLASAAARGYRAGVFATPAPIARATITRLTRRLFSRETRGILPGVPGVKRLAEGLAGVAQPVGAKFAGAASTVKYGARKYAGKGANLGLKGVSAIWNSSPVLRCGVRFSLGMCAISLVLAAGTRTAHTFTRVFRAALEYAIYFSMLMVGLMLQLFLRARRRLSMRAVHHKAFGLIRNIPEIKAKLGSPISMSEKRIEVRTGGRWKLDYNAKVESVVNSVEKLTGRDLDKDGDVGQAIDAEATEKKLTKTPGWRGRLMRAGIPIAYKYKLQRAHMVFPIEGIHAKKALISVEAVKRPQSDLKTWLQNPTVSLPPLLGEYEFKLLAVDFADNTYAVIKGDDERYMAENITKCT